MKKFNLIADKFKIWTTYNLIFKILPLGKMQNPVMLLQYFM